MFAVDIGVVSGIPIAVRVVKSTGSPVVDETIVNTLNKWRFRPRSVYKVMLRTDQLLPPMTPVKSR